MDIQEKLFSTFPLSRKPSLRLRLEAALTLAYAALLLKWKSMRQLHPWVGEPSPGRDELHPYPLAFTPEEIEILQIGVAVESVATRFNTGLLCMPQSLATKLMLRRRGITAILHLGVLPSRPDEKTHAHTWVSCGRIIVAGGPARSGVAEIARYT